MIEAIISITLISSLIVIFLSLKTLSTLRTPMASPLNEIGTQRKEMPSLPIREPVLFKKSGSFSTFEIIMGEPFSRTLPTIPSPIRYFPRSICSFVSPCAATIFSSFDLWSSRNTEPLSISRKSPRTRIVRERFFSSSNEELSTLLTSRKADRMRFSLASDFAMGQMFSTISHTPHGQMPAQKPHPMHLSSSTTYSYEPSSCSTLLIAPQ